jgi:hypothetical protein
MPDPMKNKDRDEEHRRRREAGDPREGGDDPDGREVAEALYGGAADSDTDGEDDGAQQ